MDLRRTASSVLSRVDAQIEGVSALNLEYNRSGSLLVIVSLDDLDLSMHAVKECVLDACMFHRLSPDGVFLDI